MDTPQEQGWEPHTSPSTSSFFPQRDSLKESAVSCPEQTDDSFSVGLGLQRPRPGLREFARRAGLAFLDESGPLQMEPERRAGKAKPRLVSQVRPCGLLTHRPPLSHCPAHPTVGSREWTLGVELPPSITARGGRSSNASHRQPRDSQASPLMMGSLYVFPGNN